VNLLEETATKSVQQVAGEMERIVIPGLTESQDLLSGFKAQDLSKANGQLLGLLKELTQLRLQEAHLYIQRADQPHLYSTEKMDALQTAIFEKRLSISEVTAD
jgi:hypothetical protein